MPWEQRWSQNTRDPVLGGSVRNSCSLNKPVMSCAFNKYLSCAFSGPGTVPVPGDAAVNRVLNPCPQHCIQVEEADDK